LGGNTVIGSGSIIGGNAWIVESVPPNSRIFGGAPVPQPKEADGLTNARHDFAPLEQSRREG
jgi:serine O-acetyltransferase